MSNKEKNLTILGHLHELRIRIIRCVIVLVITCVVAFFFDDQLLELLKQPAPAGMTLQAIKLTEPIGTSMRIALVAGIILAIPYLTWELLMFVSPGLTRREKKYLYIIFPWIVLMFAGGVVFSYYILTPRMIEFLLGWNADKIAIQPMLSDYVNIVTRLLLVTGLAFEFPVLTTFLARIGILKPQWLVSRRKYMIVISFVLAAIITPTIDPINQCLVAGTLIILYEMSIILARIVYRKNKTPQTAA